MSAPRVVSLVPSVTESLLAWGIEPVACTRFCEQPMLRTVGGTKNPDIAAIAQLAPDLVVVDREENRREDHDALVDRGVAVHVTHVRSIDDVDSAMTDIAAAVESHWEPLRLGPGAAPASTGHSMTAAVPIWRRPWMWLGEPTYGSAVLGALGIANVTGRFAEAYPALELEAVAALAPDLMIVPDEPYAFDERHRDELESVAPAVFVDGKDLVWWGERTRTALPRLAAVLQR